jgi:hypothetical protein
VVKRNQTLEGKIMSAIVSMESVSAKKVFQTAKDRRNRFRCLLPIFIEQLDVYCQTSTIEASFNIELAEKMSEIAIRLEDIFDRQYVDRKLVGDFYFYDLIVGLGVFNEHFIGYASPSDLTYINHRIEFIINYL